MLTITPTPAFFLIKPNQSIKIKVREGNIFSTADLDLRIVLELLVLVIMKNN
jgi:hypothetical protein